MKTRQGFVSNSSSSSFLIYGAELSSYKDEIKKKLGIEDKNRYELCDIIQKETGLEVETGSEGDDLYVGKSWDNIKDDETGLQFKQEIENIIKEKLGLKDVNFGSHSEAWYSG